MCNIAQHSLQRCATFQPVVESLPILVERVEWESKPLDGTSAPFTVFVAAVDPVGRTSPLASVEAEIV